MKVTVLIENSSPEGLLSEWGLSFLIEYSGKKYLIDAGGSGKFAQNANKLGIDLSEVDVAFLSHAHYDHALGMRAFFELNSRASFLLQEDAGEDCYSKYFFFKKYIGIEQGLLNEYKDRIIKTSGKYRVDEGVYIVPHDIQKVNESDSKPKAHFYIKQNGKYIPDLFRHEQSVVFETEKGLVIFNSCSHTGAGRIVKEVQKSFPEKKIHAIIGGFHLFTSSKSYVMELAVQLQETGVEQVITGHCTGDRAIEILKEVLGNKVKKLETGMVLVF